MIYFRTLSKAINYYIDKGYNFPFDTQYQSIVNDDWNIVQMHRFEGFSDPSDNTVLYILHHKNGKDKGIIIDAYGAGRQGHLSELLKGIKRVFSADQS